MLNTIPSMRIWGKSMGKRILIGSMLILTLLLLMPSIPAVQKISIEDKTDNELEITSKNNRLKHPLLYLFVLYSTLFRGLRGGYLVIISSNIGAWMEPFEVDYPLFYKRGWWLINTAIGWADFWADYADRHGWNW